MSPTSELIIATTAQLRNLTRPLLILRLDVRQVTLKSGALPTNDEDLAKTSNALNRHLGACGCGTGTCFFAVSLGCWGVALWGNVLPTTSIWWNSLVVIGSLLLAAALGRWVGRLLAVVRAARLAQHLLDVHLGVTGALTAMR